MPDGASIIATITAIKTSIDIVKAVRDADYDLDKAILKEKIVILVDSLLEAKIQASETLDLIQEKDEKIKKLEDLLKFKAMLVRKDGMYFESDKSGNPTDEPFCSQCWEVRNLLVHLTKQTSVLLSGKPVRLLSYYCPNCKNPYQIAQSLS